METSNLDLLFVSLPNIQYHHCSSSSSSSQAPDATNIKSQEDDQNNVNSVPDGLKIQVPSTSNGLEDDPKTPRSMDHRIPEMAACPPPPRKAKRVLPVTGKRKAPIFPMVRVPADFIVYVDAMLAMNEAVYVPDIVVGDIIGNGGHAKKLKLLSAPAPAHDL